MIEKEKLKNLPLSERLKELKKLEEERKKDIEEAKKLILETEKEFETEKAIENVEIPEPKKIDISKLFTSEDGLEATAEIEQESGEDFNIDYQRFIQGMEEQGFYRTMLIEPVIEKIETFINAPKYALRSRSDVEKSTPSVGLLEEIKKYTVG